MSNSDASLTLATCQGFVHNRLASWDSVFHADVVINSPAGRDVVGRDALKAWIGASIAPPALIEG